MVADSHSKCVKNIQESMAFAVSFATALNKIKQAVGFRSGCQLTAAEAKAVMEGFKLLKDKTSESG